MLGWDLAAALPGLRAEAESRMTETVQIGVFQDGVDLETGEPTRELVEQRYEGKARVRYPGNAVSARDNVQVVAVQDIVVSIPHGSPVCFEGDEVLVTASTADPALVGKQYTVKGAPEVGQTTAHRYPVTELS